MYPFLRMTKELVKFRRAPALDMTGLHVSHHMCWPWDLDMWAELNNGRTLTLYDLGRIPLAQRTGLIGVLRRNRWRLTIAGLTVRYRRRIQLFERLEMRSRALCWDERFIYLEQSLWKADGECANHALYRAAIVGPDGIVPPHRIAAGLDRTEPSPEVPGWVRAWIDAEAQRPWPPMQGG